jgi:hypothetical protein
MASGNFEQIYLWEARRFSMFEMKQKRYRTDCAVSFFYVLRTQTSHQARYLTSTGIANGSEVVRMPPLGNVLGLLPCFFVGKTKVDTL